MNFGVRQRYVCYQLGYYMAYNSNTSLIFCLSTQSLSLKLSLQTLVRLHLMVQAQLAVTIQGKIMTDKLLCPAVFNCGLCHTLENIK